MSGATPPGASVAPALALRDLRVTFESRDGAPGAPARRAAVSGVSLTLHPRQTLAIVGESGSGKSVTAMSIVRLLASPPARIERGRALVDTGGGGVVDTLSLPERELRRIRGGVVSIIFQEPMTALNPVLSIGSQLTESIRAHRHTTARESRDRAGAALAEVGIEDPLARLRSFPHELSGGMRQRVMIAMALEARPRILIADEPTTALDSTTQLRALELLSRARESHDMATLLITHSLSLVAARAEAVCVMWSGRIVEYGPTPDVIGAPLHPYTRALLAARPALFAARSRLGAPAPRPEPIPSAGGLRAWVPAPDADTPWALARVGADRWVGVSPDAHGAPPLATDPPDIPPARAV